MRHVVVATAALLVMTVSVSAGLAFNRAPVQVAASAALCTDLGSISGATVDRVGPLSGDKRSFSFPAHVAITSASRARALAAAICGLPRFPTGWFSCPFDSGLRYGVRFADWTGRVSISPMSCQRVTGAGFVRRPNAAFWPKLGRAMGLHNASLITFQGRAT